MYQPFPRVEGGRIYQPGRRSDAIFVGTSAWFEWLEQHSAFTYIDAEGSFTALKNRPVTGSPWIAVGIPGGQRSLILLGPSRALTLERLQAAARSLAAEPIPGVWPEAVPSEPAAESATQLSTEDALRQTRLSPPRTASDAVPRARLLALMNAGLSSPLTLVRAPAGYGRTTLLVQWLATLAQRAAWLSLEAADNELPLFVHALALALQRAVPGACPASVHLLHALNYPPLSEVVSLLVGELADLPEEVVVVLDDYHLIEQADIHTLLTQLVEHLPPQLNLVLASRTLNSKRAAHPAFARPEPDQQGDRTRAGSHPWDGQGAYQPSLLQAQRE